MDEFVRLPKSDLLLSKVVACISSLPNPPKLSVSPGTKREIVCKMIMKNNLKNFQSLNIARTVEGKVSVHFRQCHPINI